MGTSRANWTGPSMADSCFRMPKSAPADAICNAQQGVRSRSLPFSVPLAERSWAAAKALTNETGKIIRIIKAGFAADFGDRQIATGQQGSRAVETAAQYILPWGSPGGSLEALHIGRYRTMCSGCQWRQVVGAMVENAQSGLMVVVATAHVRWDLMQ